MRHKTKTHTTRTPQDRFLSFATIFFCLFSCASGTICNKTFIFVIKNGRKCSEGGAIFVVIQHFQAFGMRSQMQFLFLLKLLLF